LARCRFGERRGELLDEKRIPLRGLGEERDLIGASVVCRRAEELGRELTRL
jgi:hypothetical protein